MDSIIIIFVVIMIAFFLIGISILTIILYMDYKESEDEKEKRKEIELSRIKLEADLFQWQLEKRREYIYKRMELRDKYDKIMREEESIGDEEPKDEEPK